MIGIDLVRRGLNPLAAQPYLGALDRWAGLTVNEIRAHLVDEGWLARHDEGLPLETLITTMNDGRLTRAPEWTPAARGAMLAESVPKGDLQPQPMRCPRGHRWQAFAPYTWRTACTPVLESRPLCPYCVIEFAEKAFPALP